MKLQLIIKKIELGVINIGCVIYISSRFTHYLLDIFIYIFLLLNCVYNYIYFKCTHDLCARVFPE